MSRYAEGTSVPYEKTRVEIETTLRRFGAEAFASGYEDNRAFIQFRAKGRYVRLILLLPLRTDKAFTHSARGMREPHVALEAYEQEVRRRWRSLSLLVKAKMAAIEDGIADFESEWLANIVLPNGQTVADHTKPAIALAYQNGEMPKLLPGSST